MIFIEEYVENNIKNDTKKRNLPIINFADGKNSFTTELNRHSSNDRDHRIIASSIEHRQMNSNIYDNNDGHHGSEVASEKENLSDMWQYGNNDSYEGLNGYETFCDENP